MKDYIRLLKDLGFSLFFLIGFSIAGYSQKAAFARIDADENLILGLKIIDRVSGRVLTNDQAARFDVVSARN